MGSLSYFIFIFIYTHWVLKSRIWLHISSILQKVHIEGAMCSSVGMEFHSLAAATGNTFIQVASIIQGVTLKFGEMVTEIG